MACPFQRLAGPLLTPLQLHLDSPSGSGSGTTSPPVASPSFTPNTDAPVRLAVDKVTVPALVASLSALATSDDTLDVDDLELPEDLDLGLPISVLLREGTKRAHVQAETSKGAKALVKGELDLEEYIKWLAVLWRVYNALELALAEHSTNPVLAPTYNPQLLSRAPALAQDIAYLLTLLPEEVLAPASLYATPTRATRSTPLPPFPIPSFLEGTFYAPLAPLRTFLDHIKHLSQTSPASLLAHTYVRYLGDLSGGQYIGQRVKKAYELEGEDGTRFYQFEWKGTTSGADGESKADTRKALGEIKEWYRHGMDEGVGDDQKLKTHLIKEANLSFALNTYLFALINPPLTSGEMAVFSQSAVEQAVVQAETRLGRPLRYYEKRELEWLEKKRVENANFTPNTWRERAERFLLFVATVLIGWGLSQFGLPYLMRYLGPYLPSP